MNDKPSDYSLKAIRELLLAAFTAEDLRRFCLDDLRFRPICDRFGPGHGFDDMVDQVIDHCYTHSLWPEFLAAVQQARPNPYALYEARIGSPPLAPGDEAPRAPGAPPPIWNVPYDRNLNVTGREDLLNQLRAELTSGRPEARIQALTGLGGMGKTQLALEYAYRHAAAYDAVWWVRAEEPAALAAEYARLAGPAKLPAADLADLPEVVAAVCNWLTRHDGWLLIFDDAGDHESLRGYLPQGTLGHVIITSRNQAWRRTARTRQVRKMDRADSVAFLCQRTAQEDEAAADALADRLGDLPLALEQAGAYIETTGISLAEYCALFDTRRAELWERESPPADYPDTVATTWRLAMDQVESQTPGAAGLLSLCAFLAPEDIPRDLVSGAAEWVPGDLAAILVDPLLLNDAVAALRRYSLLEVTGGAWAIHRLVGTAVRDRWGDEARGEWAGAAIRLVNDAFPSGIPENPATWPECRQLLPHALAAAAHAEALAVAPKAAGRLLNQSGLYLQVRAQFGDAKSALERALTIDEAAFGPDHPNVAAVVNNLGEVQRNLGDYKGARAAFQRALAIWQRELGPGHPNVATAHNNLGEVQRALGDYEGARAALERALAVDEAAFGPDHPKVAIRVNNLGMVQRDLADYKGARAAFQRALAIWQRELGPGHPNVATAHNNLGEIQRALGDYEGARAAFQRALAIDEAALGPDHPNVAAAVNNLGWVLQDLGDYEGARAAYQRALAICEQTLPPDHPSLRLVRGNLAAVQSALNQQA